MSERTFDPTPQHRERMRHKGDVPLSAEMTGAITLLAAIYLLAGRMAAFSGGLQDLMRKCFSSLSAKDLTVTDLQQGGSAVMGMLAGTWLPFFLTIAGVGVAVTLAQTRGLVAISRLKPDWGHVNPISGMKRIFSKRGLFEAGKGVLKMAILAAVLYGSTRQVPGQLAMAGQAGLQPAISTLGNGLLGIARQSAIFLLAAAGLDYVFQSRQYKQRMMMTREEVTEEMKNAEGQPMLRAKIRELQRRMSRRRMMQQIAYADVVVTNPTHLAIALRYDGKKMAAPIVVAKGQGLIAQQIVKKAREHNVPIVQNIPLAHALIKVELDNPVPVDLYHAVAEVLAFVYRLRRSGAARPGQGAVL